VFLLVADWHALTTGNVTAATIRESTEEMGDRLASAGSWTQLNCIFRHPCKEHAELHLIFSMITPTSLIRNPTVKEQARELGFIQSDDETEVTKIN
jgi:tryptophanyl-tRNA synthetase